MLKSVFYGILGATKGGLNDEKNIRWAHNTFIIGGM
jgi:hypothetical protein